jgi:hypothetical protein
MTPSLLIKAEELSVGDVLLLPFNKTATITKIGPIGPRTRYVKFTTEHGPTRVEVGTEVHVKAQVL